jgi:HAMP domain-containing protein
MIWRRFVFLAAVVSFFGWAQVGRAQDNSATTATSPSLGDAARKARAQKKDSAKPAKVFTNDDMGGLKGTINVVGNGSGPQSGTDSTAQKTDAQKPTDAGKEEAAWRAKFAAARKTLAADSKEVDILQREFNLKQQQYYTDPSAALKEQHSREDLNKTQGEIEAKKHAVEKDKQALSDLEDELRKAGGNARWADEPSGGPSESSDSGSGASGGSANSANANSETSEPPNQ